MVVFKKLRSADDTQQYNYSPAKMKTHKNVRQ